MVTKRLSMVMEKTDGTWKIGPIVSWTDDRQYLGVEGARLKQLICVPKPNANGVWTAQPTHALITWEASDASTR